MVEVYIDGASAGNPGKSGAGVFIKYDGKAEQYSFSLGDMDNHSAEYYALIKSLEIALEKQYQIVSIRSDSKAVVHAFEKRFAKGIYLSLLTEALEIADKIPLVFIKWIPSKENKVADALARKAISANN